MDKYICHTKYLKYVPKIKMNKIHNTGCNKNKFSKYSKIGQKFINEKLTEYKNIVRIFETIDHDGYDEYGPKSYLWDMYIVFKNNDDLIYHNYHHEEWFDINDEKAYKLYNKQIYNNKNKQWEKIDL